MKVIQSNAVLSSGGDNLSPIAEQRTETINRKQFDDGGTQTQELK